MQEIDVKRYTAFVLDHYKINWYNSDLDQIMFSYGLKYEEDIEEE